jgi:hypothetical protein
MRVIFDIAARLAGQSPFSIDTSAMRPNSAIITAEVLRPDIMIAAGMPATFAALRFGVTVTADGVPIYDKQWPADNVRFLSSDQRVLLSDRVTWTQGQDIAVIAWVEESGERFTATFNTPVPQPAQPFPSWGWDAAMQKWSPPVPYPDDGGHYDWDEAALRWVLVA